MKPRGGKRILIALIVSAIAHWSVLSLNYFEIKISEQIKNPASSIYSVTWKTYKKQEDMVAVIQPINKPHPKYEKQDSPDTNNVQKPIQYFASKELSIRPSPLQPVVVPLPEGSEPFSGNVILEIFLSTDGSIDSISVIGSNLPAHFAEIAIESFKSARFSPGYLNGNPVPSKMKIAIDFISSKNSPENR